MYLRDTRARIVRPNNMPGLRAANDGIVRLAGEIFTTLRLEKSPANILSSLSLRFSLQLLNSHVQPTIVYFFISPIFI